MIAAFGGDHVFPKSIFRAEGAKNAF